MKKLRKSTISNRIITSDIFLLVFMILSSYFMNWFENKTYFAIYYASCILAFVFILFIQWIYLNKTTLKPLKKLSKDVLIFNKHGKIDKKFVYKDKNVEEINENLKVTIARMEQIDSKYDSFVSSVTASCIDTLKSCENMFKQIQNGSMLKKKELKDSLVAIKETNMKLQILKNIAMINNSHYETIDTKIDIVSKINDIIFSKQTKILKKKLVIEYDCSSNQILSKIDEASFELIFGSILDVAIALLQEGKEIRLVVDNTQTDFTINITAKDSIISSSLALVLFSDYNLEDIDNVNLLSLVLVKKLCLKNNFAFSLNTTHDGFTVFRVVKR